MKLESRKQIALFVGLMFLCGVYGMAQPGAADPAFGVAGRVTTDFAGRAESVNDVAIQSDGKIVAVGSAGEANLDFAVTRYTTAGNLDTGFSGDGIVVTPLAADSIDFAVGVAIQPDGKIVVGGHSSLNGQHYFSIVRYNSDGTLDNSFNGTGIVLRASNPSTSINDLLLQPDGRIVLVGGTVANIATGEDFCLVRYNSNGTLDSSFGAGGIAVAPIDGNQTAYAVALTSTGRIVVGGRSTSPGEASSKFAIASFGSNGSAGTFRDWFVTTRIGTGGNEVGQGLAIQSDGKIVLAGTAEHSNLNRDMAVVRYNPGHSLDTGFGVGGIVIRESPNVFGAADLTIQPSGRINVAGSFRGSPFSQTYFTLQRFNPDGSNPMMGIIGFSFASNTDCFANAVAMQPDGNIILAGKTGDLGSSTNGFALMRLQGDSRERADFDGDRKSDLSIFRSSNGQWWSRNSSNGSISAFAFGTGTDRITPGDFDGDGRTDRAFFRQSTGEWFVFRSSNSTFYSYPFGTSGDVPAAGDFDGDWKTDFAVFRPSTGIWYIAKTTGGTSITQWGISGDLPVPSDYDGDGKADVGIFRPSNGSWWINRSTTGVFVTSFGSGSDRAVPDDYTGDGKADVAFWRPSTGGWYVLRSEDLSYFSVPFGISSDLPATGDYDGDGKADLAVFRPSTGAWYVSGSRSGTTVQQFGSVGDVPVSTGYVP